MIRKADINDLDAVYQLTELILPKWTKNMVADVLNLCGADIYISEVAEQAVGFVCIEYVLDEGCISGIAVRPENRQQGIASTLLEVAMKSREVASIYLEVCEDNYMAINLYQKHKFVRAGLRKNYYGKKSAIILVREF